MASPTNYTCTAGAHCRAPHPPSQDTGGHWRGWRGTAADFGRRKDGRRNTLCPTCRSWVAASGARKSIERRAIRPVPRDQKALIVVERWCGMRYQETGGWTTPAAVEWQIRRGLSLQEVWTARMRRLAARAARCDAARRRLLARAQADADHAA